MSKIKKESKRNKKKSATGQAGGMLGGKLEFDVEIYALLNMICKIWLKINHKQLCNCEKKQKPILL